jgi:ABC-type transporter Mla MlaB component
MLRITREAESGHQATLRLEGSVAAEWAALLEHECVALARSGMALGLDLAGVGFVDRAGIAILARLGRAGVEIRCRPGTVASVLEAEGVPITLAPDHWGR